MKEFSGDVVIIDPAKFTRPEDLGTKIDTKIARISPKLGFNPLFFTTLGREKMFLNFYKVDNIKEYYSQGTETWVKSAIQRAFNGVLPKSNRGQISIDSGSIGVFLLSDIEKYNPGSLEGLKNGEDYILLPGYKGKIGFLRDKYGIVHFYGTGANNFYLL